MRKILALLLILLLVTPVFAQEAEKNKIFILNSFQKGLNTKENPYTLPKGSATIAENVRLDKEGGSLAKRDTIRLYGGTTSETPVLGLHKLYMADLTAILLRNLSSTISTGNDATGAFTDILTVTTADRRWQWLTWHNVAIGTDGYNQPVKYDGSSASATYIGSCLGLDAGSGAGPDGTYLYKVTFYTTTYEVSLGASSNTVVVVDNDIDLTMIPIAPDTYAGESVTGRKIYRTEDGGTTYKILSNGVIANNTAVTLTDSDADGALGATLNPTVTLTPPKGRLCIIHKNRLWIANNPDHPSRVYYSDSGSENYFPSANYFDVRTNDGDEVTLMKNLLEN